MAQNQVDAQKKKIGILVVDDERNILMALKRLLHRQGYRIFLAGGGEEGLEILARESIDLVISDMRMPSMDGAVYLHQSAAPWPNTIRILFTGYSALMGAVDPLNQGPLHHY